MLNAIPRKRRSQWAKRQLNRLFDDEGGALDLFVMDEAATELTLTPLYNELMLEGKAGYVYLIRSDAGYYKIGLTTNPQSRIKSIRSSSPLECEILYIIKTCDCKSLESLLHHRYAAKRVRGEWFLFGDERRGLDLLIAANHLTPFSKWTQSQDVVVTED